MDEEQKFSFEISDNGKYVVVCVACPNCRRVNRSKKVKSDEVHEEKNIKCKCGITGFDWTYFPPQVGDAYVRINSCASISAANWPKVVIHNQKNFHLTNGA
jgi:hypothetical protein